MKISSSAWKSYVDRLSKIDHTAAEKVASWYRNHPDADINELVNITYYYCDHYGSAAAELACEMYEEMADASGKVIKTADPAITATRGEIYSAIQGTLLRTQNPDAIGAIAGRKVKTVGLDTLINNSLRDGAEFAWIPSGDTCAFCIMLASNGWQRASKKALKNGHASHVHNNCDCTYAIRFDENTEVEGYDPDYYKSLYDNAEGDNWRDKTNYIRRKQYADNPEKYREQKKIAYQKLIADDNMAIIASHSDEYREYLQSIKGNADNLKRRQKRLLDRVPDPLSWTIVKSKNLHIRDIAALTAATGDEFTIFQRGSKKILLRGKGVRWAIPEDLFNKIKSEQWVWDSHSHPVTGIPVPSSDDRSTLSIFTWQDSSVIINLKGETVEFTASEQDWFNSILGIK